MDCDDKHISWSEAEDVVRLHRQITGMSERISLDTLSEALGADPQSTRAMLAEVRDNRRRQKRLIIDRGGIISAGIAAVIAVGYVGFYVMSSSPQPMQTKVVSQKPPALAAKRAALWPSVTEYRVKESPKS